MKVKDGFLLGILVFYPFIGGLLAYLAGRKNEKSRNVTAYVIALSELAIMLYLMACYGPFAVRTESGHAFLEFTVPKICGLGLHFTLDGFRVIYGTIVAPCFPESISGITKIRTGSTCSCFGRLEQQWRYFCPQICLPLLFSLRSCRLPPIPGLHRKKIKSR